MRTMRIKLLLAIAAAFIGLVLLADWAVELLWLGALGYEGVFWTLRLLKVGFFLIAFVPLFLWFWINLSLLSRRLDLGTMIGVVGRYLRQRTGAVGAYLGGTDDHEEETPSRAGVHAPLAAGGALFFGLAFAAGWDILLQLWWAGDYGRADPIFGHDVGFYLFTLPFLELVQTSLVAATLLTLGGVTTGYLRAGAMRVDWKRGIEAPPAVLLHFGINVALFLGAWAWGYYLDRYALLQSTRGVVHGAGYTDVFVVQPALWIVLGATVALAVAALYPAVLRNLRVAVAAGGGYLVILGVPLFIAPWAVQAFKVEPNELELETPFLRHNIAFTRDAFGIDGIKERSYAAFDELTPQDLRRNRQTIDNIRLWDWRPLTQTVRQLQRIRTYYEFNDVDVDRYQVDGAYRQVMVAARELSNDLPDQAETWVNRHLQYTHGYGLAMNLAAKKSDQGVPEFLVKDLPPSAVGGLAVTQPAIYYGEENTGYRIVSTAVKEFDYPKGDENVYTHYRGQGGVALDAWWKKVLFAWQQFDVRIALTAYTQRESRIQLWRTVRDRVSRIAPFLRLDRDPYIVLGDGRLYWVQDAYVTARTFPYSEPGAGHYNYIRNSVKVVVDAYEGDVVFYVMDPGDPVLGVYRRALPALFRPLAEMPESLRRHLRYPQELFQAQVHKYNTYHMTVPQVFYNGEDIWAVPQRNQVGPEVRVGPFRSLAGSSTEQDVDMKPYYILMKLLGEEQAQFLLMSPLTPSNRDNMIAWMAARCDFPTYGQLLVYKLPKERLILGPAQVEAMIDQDTGVSQQISLWDQRGSRVIRGSLLVIPVEQSFLYVKPIYLLAEQASIPQLKRIIVSDGKRLAMESTLEGALKVVFGDIPALAPAPSDATTADPFGGARRELERAEKALRDGDWDAFGRAMQSLKATIAQ
jgi:uncharacterized membrane protein (UPF0182 family)